jgi:hypothetical protein
MMSQFLVGPKGEWAWIAKAREQIIVSGCDQTDWI